MKHPSLHGRRALYCLHWRSFFLLLFILATHSDLRAWSQDRKRIGFREEGFSEVFAKIERTFAVRVFFDAGSMPGSKVTLQEDARTLPETLTELEKRYRLRFKVEGNTVAVQAFPMIPLVNATVPQEKDIAVRGKVIDATGQALAGVTVRLVNGNKGVTTNATGQYTIVVPENSTLSFSIIGYEKKEIRVQGKTELNVKLEVSRSELDQVVVVGYGTQQKEKVTAAVSTISGKELENKPAASFESMLQGKAPGLMVLNNSGAPGQRSTLMIRGIAAVAREANKNVVSTPLFVIDGVPMIQEVDPVATNNNSAPLNSLLAGVNPYDIASIDILKDASAAAIYGSRAANGVVFINTKRGKVGKPIVSVNTQYGISYFPELRPTLGGNSERALKLKLRDIYSNQAYNNNIFPDRFIGMPQELSDSLNPFFNNSTDWQGLLFRNSTFSDVNVAVSGGTNNTTYRLSAGYYDEKGIVLGTGFKRYSLTYNGSFNPVAGLNISSVISMNQTDMSRGKGTTVEEAVVGNEFLSSLYPAPSSSFFSDYVDAYKSRTDNNLRRSIQATLQGTYDITRWLTFTARGSANYVFSKRRTFNPARINNNRKPSASIFFQEDLNLVNENFLRLHHSFNKTHTFDLTLGNSINTFKTENVDGSGINGPADQIQVIQGYPQADIRLASDYLSYGLISYYSRLTYDYKAKYLLQLAARTDGSSKFGANNQWGFFPSASAGWIFSKEPFFESLLGKWVNFGKVRAGIGISGNQYNDYYLAVGQYQVGNSGSGGTYNGIPINRPNYSGSNGIPLPELSWEKSTQYDFGVDLELFNGRATIGYDYYYKRTDNFLFDDPLPPTSGYAKQYINGGQVANWGTEFSVTAYTMPANRNFQWNITLNASFNRNALLKLPDGGRSVLRSADGLPWTIAPQLMIGKPLNGYFMWMQNGVYPSTADVPVDKFTGKRPQFYYFGYNNYYLGGDTRFVDLNKNNIIDDNDRVYMGDPNPKVYGGINNTFRYQFGERGAALELGVFFTYVLGRKIYNEALRSRLEGVTWTDNVYPYVKDDSRYDQQNVPNVALYDIWWPDNTDARYPALNPWRSRFDMPNVGYNVNNLGTRFNSAFLENGNFLRLKSLSLSYDLGRASLDRLKIRRLRVFGSMDNVFILQKYSGVDAENVDSYGYDRGNGYPIPKKFNAGFNFEF